MVGGVLSRLWTDCCAVIVRETVHTGEGVSGIRETLRYASMPCRLSYFRSARDQASVEMDGMAARTVQATKLILPPDADVPPGSRIQVKRGDRTLEFRASGQPRRYRAHQEIILEAVKWA